MLNEAANYIRQYGRLHIAQLAYNLGVSVTKAYQMKPLIVNMFSDIRFERGYFYVEKTGETQEGETSQDAKR
jgi:predicted DNA-binding transcriptional regulator YafY